MDRENLIVFDFDGVLIDSIDEVALTAFLAIDKSSVFTLRELPSGFLAIFKNNRFLVQPAGDFLPFAKWCLSQVGNQNSFVTPSQTKDASSMQLQQKQFKNLLQETSEPLPERTEKFFAARKRLKEANPKYWFQLNATYQPLWKALQHVQRVSHVILTNKNQQAVAELCEHFQLPIQMDQIYSGDQGSTKVENLMCIQEKYRASLFVIDDSVYNLLELKTAFQATANITFALATWGYLGPEDEDLARQNAIPLLSQKDVIDLL